MEILMKKSRFQKKWLIYGLLFLLLAAGRLYLKYGLNDMLYSRNWNIDIPSGLRERYHTDTGSAPHGEGVFYTVYERRDETLDVLKAFSNLEWSKEEHSTKHKDSYSAFILDYADQLEVPQEKRPDLKHCVFYYKIRPDRSELIAAYDTFSHTLYFVSHLM